MCTYTITAMKHLVIRVFCMPVYPLACSTTRLLHLWTSNTHIFKQGLRGSHIPVAITNRVPYQLTNPQSHHREGGSSHVGASTLVPTKLYFSQNEVGQCGAIPQFEAMHYWVEHTRIVLDSSNLSQSESASMNFPIILLQSFGQSLGSAIRSYT